MSDLSFSKLSLGLFSSRLYRKFQRYIVAILFGLLILGFGVGFVASDRLSVRLVDSQAEQYARAAVDTLNTARTLYSDNVVMRVKESEGVSVGAEYHLLEGGNTRNHT